MTNRIRAVDCHICVGAGIIEDHDGEVRPCPGCEGVPTPCRLGYVEYDGDQYCFEHGGFTSEYGPHPRMCDRRLGIRGAS